ncbi:MAG: hypothetical protein LH616_03895 [Ilumatobacteraceae bacterium]|nr:hypothetical protein [Ilumatobacteraceae bacterium]
MTIVGPGGAGKTSVAVAAATALTGVSVRFAELGSIGDPQGLLPTLLAAVGRRSDDLDQALGAVVARLNSFCQPVLVLDNCEHLLSSVSSAVVELLGACPSLSVLATSREPLGVPGESIISCPPLTVESAIDLWTARSQSADRDYVADETERIAVRVMIVWTACLLGETTIAEHHAAILAVEYALQSTVTEATTVLAAFAATAEGLLALAQGMDATATQALRRAIQLSAEGDLWDIVGDLVDHYLRWPAFEMTASDSTS